MTNITENAYQHGKSAINAKCVNNWKEYVSLLIGVHFSLHLSSCQKTTIAFW